MDYLCSKQHLNEIYDCSQSIYECMQDDIGLNQCFNSSKKIFHIS